MKVYVFSKLDSDSNEYLLDSIHLNRETAEAMLKGYTSVVTKIKGVEHHNYGIVEEVEVVL